jgi:hypothetical protein
VPERNYVLPFYRILSEELAALRDALTVFQIVLERVLGLFLINLRYMLFLQYFFTFTAQKMALAIGHQRSILKIQKLIKVLS